LNFYRIFQILGSAELLHERRSSSNAFSSVTQ
jgi:hypothetical protein